MTTYSKHVGTITLATGTWDLFEQYPTKRRDYKITSAVPVGKPTCAISFTSEASFERWLGKNLGHVQLPLL